MRHFMPFTADTELAAIADGLLDRTLPKRAWTHAGHFAAAIWILARRPEIDAARDMPDIIRAYNEATGGRNSDTEGYHETITQASLLAAGAWLRARPGVAPFLACNGLLQSPFGEPGWLLRYWSSDLLFSVRARRNWVPPDLADFPDGPV